MPQGGSVPLGGSVPPGRTVPPGGSLPPGGSVPLGTPPATGSVPPGSAAPLDEDVRFSVVRPSTVRPRSTVSLVVFAHRGGPYLDPELGPVDPQALVERRTRALFGAQPTRSSSVDAAAPVVRGTALRVEVAFPGVLADPASAQFDWRGGMHEIAFRLHIPGHLAGQTVRGAVRVCCGPLILAETTVALTVGPSGGPVGGPVGDQRTERDELVRYRKIFPSYAHADGTVVEQFEAVVGALGDRYLRDVVTLRSGEVWNDRLLELIEEADVFQLFWSERSMRSPYCRQEWEHALSLNREGFVRPLYWQHPLPSDEALGLPPAELRRLHFAGLAGVPDRPVPPPPRAPGGRRRAVAGAGAALGVLALVVASLVLNQGPHHPGGGVTSPVPPPTVTAPLPDEPPPDEPPATPGPPSVELTAAAPRTGEQTVTVVIRRAPPADQVYWLVVVTGTGETYAVDELPRSGRTRVVVPAGPGARATVLAVPGDTAATLRPGAGPLEGVLCTQCQASEPVRLG